MDTKETCPECGESLSMTQYAHDLLEGRPNPRGEDHLVCHNYPACSRAEKEVSEELRRGGLSTP